MNSVLHCLPLYWNLWYHKRLTEISVNEKLDSKKKSNKDILSLWKPSNKKKEGEVKFILTDERNMDFIKLERQINTAWGRQHSSAPWLEVLSISLLEHELGLLWLFSYLVFLGLASFLIYKGIFPVMSTVLDMELVLNKSFSNGWMKDNAWSVPAGK